MVAFHPYVNLNIKVRIIFDTAKFFNTFFHKRMRFVYVDIFLYICIMDNEEDFDFIDEKFSEFITLLYKIGELEDHIPHLNTDNRNKIVHCHGK